MTENILFQKNKTLVRKLLENGKTLEEKLTEKKNILETRMNDKLDEIESCMTLLDEIMDNKGTLLGSKVTSAKKIK